MTVEPLVWEAAQMVERESGDATVPPAPRAERAERESADAGPLRAEPLRSSAEAEVRKRRRRPWYQKKRFLLPIGAAVALAVVAVALATRSESSRPAEAAVTHCAKDPRGAVVAQGVVINSSGVEQDYRVSVRIIDGGGNQFAAGEAEVVGVSADGRAPWTVRTGSQPPDGGFRCQVAAVERLLP